MRIIIALLMLFISSSVFANDSAKVLRVAADLKNMGVATPPSQWFKPESCVKNPGDYFYISIGDENKAVFKVRKSILLQAGPQGYNISGDGPTFEFQENTGCLENPLNVFRVLLYTHELHGRGFIIRLKSSNSVLEEKLSNLRDSGKCPEIKPGLIDCMGSETLSDGTKQPVEYFMSRNKKDIQKTGGPLRTKCIFSKNANRVCSISDEYNHDVDYEAFTDNDPTLGHLHDVYSQMQEYIGKITVLNQASDFQPVH